MVDNLFYSQICRQLKTVRILAPPPHASRSQVFQEPVTRAVKRLHDQRRHLGVLVVAAHRPAVERAVEELRGGSTRRVVNGPNICSCHSSEKDRSEVLLSGLNVTHDITQGWLQSQLRLQQ